MTNLIKLAKKLALRLMKIEEDLPTLTELWVYCTLSKQNYGCKNPHKCNKLKCMKTLLIKQPYMMSVGQ